MRSLPMLSLIQPSIVVVVDSATGLPLADATQAVVRHGSFADTLVPYGYDASMVLRSLAMRGERPGRYHVSVAHGGFRPWQRAPVTIEAASCHTTQATLTASLARVP